MLRVQISSRAAALKPGDYDHEIGLVDHDTATRLQPVTLVRSRIDGLRKVSTTSPLLGADTGSDDTPSAGSGDDQDPSVRLQERPVAELDHEQALPHAALQPSIEVQEPTHEAFHGHPPAVVPRKPQDERETAIDILYQNERGGLFCGLPLFSGAALGGLDPPPWTNAYHRPSPTSIDTATVPDPSWAWVWPRWHVNHQDGVDESGWEYSFAFSRHFSWHGSAAWWNSFVRRRAWTRKRARTPAHETASEPHRLNAAYFVVRPQAARRSPKSPPSSRAPSTTGPAKPRIADMDTLLRKMRFSRVDRERLDAMESYLAHAEDLGLLQGEMHEIMATFVFQASRRILLSRLIGLHDRLDGEAGQQDDGSGDRRRAALHEAVKHADEEVRRLAYWSDIKKMAVAGEASGAVDERLGWHRAWEGVDQSGPSQPNRGKLPAS